MIRHLFKMVWNQKGKNLGLSFEIFFSFLVLFAVFSVGVTFLKNYQQPLGFQYEDVWEITMSWSAGTDSAVAVTQQRLAEMLRQQPEIVHAGLSSFNTPFSSSTEENSVSRGERRISTSIHTADEHLAHTLQFRLLAGRWFTPEDAAATLRPVVITASLADELFAESEAVGGTVRQGDEEYKVVGVIEAYRYHGELATAKPGLVQPRPSNRPLSSILLKVNDRADAAFEARMVKMLQQASPGWTFEVAYLDDKHKDSFRASLLPLIILSIVGGFLVFNVALGLFGVLWQNIGKRREEIGVRRAMGAVRGEISGQFIGEMLVLASLSLVIGLFFAAQFPLLNVFALPADIYLWAMLLATLTIYLLVFLCAFLPSRQAAQLHPAVALREE